MEDFENSIEYDGELPTSHEKLTDFMDEESPRKGTSSVDSLKAVGYPLGGFAVGGALSKGLYESGMLEGMGVDPATVAIGFPVAGLFVGTHLAFERVEKKRRGSREKRSLRRRARDLEETEEDFEKDLREEEYVVVCDNLLGDGEPLERSGDVAAELYNEASGMYDTQYMEETGSFPGIDYQLSLWEDDEVVRSFYAGEDIVEDAEETYQDRDLALLFEENSDYTVSLEDYE